jgi:hypothetical protein
MEPRDYSRYSLDQAIMIVSRDLSQIVHGGQITMPNQRTQVNAVLDPLARRPDFRQYMDKINAIKMRHPEQFEEFSRKDLSALSVLKGEEYIARMLAYYLTKSVTNTVARERYSDEKTKWIERIVIEVKKEEALEKRLVERE